jgi:hypothetical protein
MSDSMIERVFSAIDWCHDKLLQVTAELTAEQFLWRPGPEAPPIGWHLWHIARYADRVQASFPSTGNGTRQQIWEVEELALRWELDPATLGPIQGGEGMEHRAAAALPQQIGQASIADYARRSFAFYNGVGDDLTPLALDRMRPSPYAYKGTEDGRVIADPTKESTLGSDLVQHLSHVSRHLGMIEALRGAQALHGTASI